jgi:hypothetical protein
VTGVNRGSASACAATGLRRHVIIIKATAVHKFANNVQTLYRNTLNIANLLSTAVQLSQMTEMLPQLYHKREPSH